MLPTKFQFIRLRGFKGGKVNGRRRTDDGCQVMAKAHLWQDELKKQIHGFGYGIWCHFQKYFSDIVTVSFIGGGTKVSTENHHHVASHWQILSHNVVSSTLGHERYSKLTTLVVIGADCTGSCKSNYHTIRNKTVLITLLKCLLWNKNKYMFIVIEKYFILSYYTSNIFLSQKLLTSITINKYKPFDDKLYLKWFLIQLKQIINANNSFVCVC